MAVISSIVDNNPQDTHGHGTEVANLLFAKRNNGFGIAGLGPTFIELLPLRAAYGDFFQGVKRAVNMEADILNVGMYGILDREYDPAETKLERVTRDAELECSPIHGHAISRAIKRNLFFVLPAGHGTSYLKHTSGLYEGCFKWFLTDKAGRFLRDASNQLVSCPKMAAGGMLGRDGKPRCLVPNLDNKEQGCLRSEQPGPIYSPKFNGPVFYGNTAQLACWGRYFKGALTVGSQTSSSQISSFSNWGIDGVEILAPGENIRTVDLQDQIKVVNGTSFSVPQITYAAAVVIGFFKQMKLNQPSKIKEWYYDPWLVEDLLSQSAQVVSNLKAGIVSNVDTKLAYNGERYLFNTTPQGSRGLVQGRILNYQHLYDYLTAFKSKSFDDRRRIASENTEIGSGFNPTASDMPEVELTGIQAYAEELFNRNLGRIQLQAVAYYSNGSSKVVTDKVTWSSSSEQVPISTAGIAYPELSYTGSVTFSATYESKTNTTLPILISDNNLVSNSDSLKPEEIEIEIEKIACNGAEIRVFAKYPGEGRRDVTKFASISQADGVRKDIVLHFGLNVYRGPQAKAGSEIKVIAFYYGVRAERSFVAPTCEYNADVGSVLIKTARSADNLRNVKYATKTARNAFEFALAGPLKQEATIEPSLQVICKSGCTGKGTESFFDKTAIQISISQTPQQTAIINDVYLQAELLKKTKWVDPTKDGQNHLTYKLDISTVSLTKLEMLCQPSQSLNTTIAKISCLMEHHFSDGTKSRLQDYVRDNYEVVARDGANKDELGLAISLDFQSRLEFLFAKSIEGQKVNLEFKHKTFDFIQKHSLNLHATDRGAGQFYDMPSMQLTQARIQSGWQLLPGVNVGVNSVQNTNTQRSRDCQSKPEITLNRTLETGNSPLILICHPEELRPFIFDLRAGLVGVKRSRLVLGAHLDISVLGLKFYESIVASTINGNGYELQNLSRMGSEVAFYPIISVSAGLLNIGFRNISAFVPAGFLYGFIETPIVVNSYFDQVSLEFSGFSVFENSFLRTHYVKNVAMTRFEGRSQNRFSIFELKGSILTTNDSATSVFTDLDELISAAKQDRKARGLSSNLQILTVENVYINARMQTSSAPGGAQRNTMSVMKASDLTKNQDCWQGQVFNYRACTIKIDNILLEGSIKTHGPAAPFVFAASLGLSNAVSYMNIESSGDEVGGLYYRDSKYIDTSSGGALGSFYVYNSSVHGDVRGRHYVGALTGKSYPNVKYIGVTATSRVFGSEFVGGLAGLFESTNSHGQFEMRNTDLTQVQLNTTGVKKGDLFGAVEIQKTKRKLSGPEDSSMTLIKVLEDNRPDGPFPF